MTKNQINFRASDQTAERIDTLSAWLNDTQTNIISKGVDVLFEIERTKRMNTQTLTEAIARAVAKMESEGITGWGLNNPDEELFESVTVSSAHGCTSQTCNHVSHDPAEPDYKIIPKAGKLVYLGDETGDEERRYEWHVLITDNEPRFFELRDPRHYHSSIQEISPDQIPDWALARLAKN